LPKLTKRSIDALKEPGLYGDGEGLYLRVGPTLSKSWILRTVVHGKRRDFGLGSASHVSLAEARETARAYRKKARQGSDPVALRRKQGLTFADAAREVHASMLPTWRNPKHGQIWISGLERYAFPIIGKRQIDSLTSADVLAVLTPVWVEKHETAKRLRQRLGAIFDWARGAGHYPHENPVSGIKKALPVVRPKVQHMNALDWKELPAFFQQLDQREGMSARAFEFLILTCGRSNEIRGARWSEIAGNVWDIPGERMKAGRSHRVPLSDRALAVLEDVRGLDDDLIFPSTKRADDGSAVPMSDTVFHRLMKRMKVEGITAHGFRSTFRDWCSESARADRELAEAALAHSFGSLVERAYARSDLFDRRRELMDAWARFVTGESGDVVQMVRA